MVKMWISVFRVLNYIGLLFVENLYIVHDKHKFISRPVLLWKFEI